MPDYQPVPVDAARDIANIFGKSIVIIVSWDRAHSRTHTTSYGASAEDKEHAAMGADACARALGLDVGAMEVHEDFHRDYDPAKYRALLEAARPFVEWVRRREEARKAKGLPALSGYAGEPLFFGIGQDSAAPLSHPTPRVGDLLRLVEAAGEVLGEGSAE